MDLSKLTVFELKKKCKSNKIKGYSKMCKDELIKILKKVSKSKVKKGGSITTLQYEFEFELNNSSDLIVKLKNKNPPGTVFFTVLLKIGDNIDNKIISSIIKQDKKDKKDKDVYVIQHGEKKIFTNNDEDINKLLLLKFKELIPVEFNESFFNINLNGPHDPHDPNGQNGQNKQNSKIRILIQNIIKFSNIELLNLMKEFFNIKEDNNITKLENSLFHFFNKVKYLKKK